ncbi:MAG TPA: serine/threonine-protein kinase [Planctomycetota bacterium]|nr:serine/threonine-protein kinase [Planctomycetota bacterium]
MSNPFLESLPLTDGKPTIAISTLTVERKLRDSQFAEIFLAHHDGLDIPVLLRVIKPGVAEQIDSRIVDDLHRSIREYAKIRHTNLTAVYDVGFYKGQRYNVIEFSSGVPLNERLKERPLSECDALKILNPIADGLFALWRADYIHRGVSPARILVDSEGVPKLDVVNLPRIALDPALIEAHAPYMAGFWPPEELKQSRNIDERSDMFSFGATLFCAVTGQSPFGKGSRTELIARTLTETPRDPRELKPDLAPDFCAFIMRCLQADPAKRFECTCEFIEELNALKNNIQIQPTLRPSSFGPLTMSDTTVAPAVDARPLAVGDSVGQCKLEYLVGAGAFGVVFKARHQLLDIPIAVKVLPIDLASKNPDYVALFLREARTAIRIRHKHVIGLYEAGQQHGQYYLTMEFAPNGSVLQLIEKSGGKLPPDRVIRIIRETALGLGAAEEIKIVHRDIKPANLMFGAEHEIKIADLGLAKRLPVANPISGQVDLSIRNEQLTMLRGENSIQGTPAYMAPEMATSPDKIDIRADLYSLGITAYHMLTGSVPFDSPNQLQIMVKHVTQVAVPPRELNSAIPVELEKIVMKLLEKDPGKRFQRPGELVAALG